MENSKFSTIKEFAKATGLSEHFICQLVKAEKIPTIRSGVKFYIDTEKAVSSLRNND